jgi:SAM-dependent methyltransferase
MPAFRACNLCGNTSPKLRWERNGYSIVECNQCGLQYVGEDPKNIDFATLYSEAYYTGGSGQVFANYVGEERSRRASARRKLRSMRRRTTRSGRLLDVGCAAGFFLIEARNYFETQGVEISEFSSRIARERFGLDVVTGSLQDAKFTADSFDVITMWDVVEHLPDPKAVLVEASRVLKPGGSLVLTTGDVGSRYARRAGPNWHLFEPPWHLYFFSQATMSAMGAAAGLRFGECSSTGVASDLRVLRSLPGRVVTNLLGLGDIMEMTLTK